MAAIDEYSMATVPIEMYFGSTFLSLGTAFVWKDGDKHFLITNWHNVTGIDPFTGKHISANAGEPDRMRIWFNVKGKLGEKRAKFLDIRDGDCKPLWWIHPQHKKNVDVVALSLGLPDYAEPYPINALPSKALRLQIGMDVFVLGYPFGIGPEGFPVWKRGSIASEPEILPEKHPMILIDTASRPGMSGSPIIRRSWGAHMLDGNNIEMGSNTATRFIGVYSGRLESADPLDAQLGISWPAQLVSEIVAGKTLDA